MIMLRTKHRYLNSFRVVVSSIVLASSLALVSPVSAFSVSSYSSSSLLILTTSRTPLTRNRNRNRRTRRSSSSRSCSSESSTSTTTTTPLVMAAAAAALPISTRIGQTLDPCVVKTKDWMQLYAPLWAPNGGIYSLAQGVVYWSPPRSCVTAVREAVTEDNEDNPLDLLLHTYGPAQGVPAFRTALYEKLWREHHMAATNHDVTVTAGANQAYMNIVLTVMGGTTDTTTITTDKAIVFAPYYFNHVMALQMCCGKEAVLVGPTNMDTGYPDIAWLAQTLHEYNTPPPETPPLPGSISRVRMVTLVNPGNPTGMALSSAYVREVVALCKQYNVWCVLDCTYEHFLNSPETVPHLPTFPNEEHVLHIFSFSKGYSLAGYRCGYLVSCNNQNPNTNLNPFNQDMSASSSSSSSFLPNMLKVQGKT